MTKENIQTPGTPQKLCSHLTFTSEIRITENSIDVISERVALRMRREMRQTGFRFIKDYKKEFGGSLLTGKRKTARPLSLKKPIHLILKSTGSSCFVPGDRKIESLIKSHAEKYGIKLYEISLNWSHIHMLIKLPSRDAYLAFIRTITSLLVSFLSKFKGKSLKGLFDLRPFTKILSWGRHFKMVIQYHELNDMEARGFKRAKKKTKKSRKARH